MSRQVAAGNGGNPINAQPVNATEADITAVWKQMSEDYAPFNVNITTNEAIFLAAPKGKRMRCIFTPTNYFQPGLGGVAYLDSYSDTDDTPCWVFNFSGDPKDMAEAGSHEVGHTLDLNHDGRTSPSEGYYEGHNDGRQSWV